MWRLIYNLLVCCLLPLFVVLSLTKKKIRKNLRERMFPTPADGDLKGAIWIHAASLGEAVIAENFITYLRASVENPFIVTTNTYYTRDLLRRRFSDRLGVYSLPLDVPYSINRFMGGNSFAALLLVETEIWPNLIWIAKGRRIPVVIINGRISDSTINHYRRFSFFLRKVLASVDIVLAQSEEQARRFVALGMEPSRVINTGNLKYYREIKEVPENAEREIVTFGSIKEKELPILVPAIKDLKRQFPELLIFIAPREIRLITAIERQLSDDFRIDRYSVMKQGTETGRDIVLVDTVGDLMSIYARSRVAFVGGSLAPYGGQNLLEPLFVNTPVIFGPHVGNFQAAADDVLSQGAGFMVRDGAELLSAIKLVLADEKTRHDLARAGRAVLAIQKGAMEKTAAYVLETIWKNSPNLSN